MDDEGGWAAGIDRLLLRVTDDLRHAGVELPDTRLRGVAERLVLEAAHFVLDWVETPTGARPAPALLERGSGS